MKEDIKLKFSTNFLKIKKLVNIIKFKDIRFFKSVSLKITAEIGILVVTVCAVLGFISYYSSYKSMEKNINSQLKNKATQSSKLISEMLSGQIKSMLQIADREEIKSMNPKVEIPILNEKSKELNYSNLGVMDLSGLTYMEDGTKTQNNLTSDDSQYMKNSIKGKGQISGPYFNINGEQIIEVSVPIKKNGSVIGVLFANIGMSELNKLVQGMKVGNTGYCFIVDSNGTKVVDKNLTLVLNRDNTIKNAQKDKSLEKIAELEKDMIKGNKGYGCYNMKGVDKLLAYSPIPGIKWYLGLTMDKREIFSSVELLKYKMMAATLIFIIIGVIIGIIISLRIKAPVVKIRKYALELSKFNFRCNLDIKRQDEFGQLADDLKFAIKNIEGMIKCASDEGKLTLRSSNYIKDMFDKSKIEVNTVVEGSGNITASMEEVLASVEDLGERITSVKTVVGQTVDEIGAGLDFADKINKKAEIMKNRIKKSQTDLQEQYNTSSEKLKESLNTIKIVKNIFDMLKQIRNISKKTNIIAVNAHIESARAGEYGKGFMVVAGEVRKLAEQSSSVVDKIQGDVKDMTDAVSELIGCSRDMLSSVEEKIVKEYAHIINMSLEYQNDSNKIKDFINKFYVLADSINLSHNELCGIINEIIDTADKCTSDASDISESMESIEAKNTHIGVKTDENAVRAEELIKIVNKFKINV